MKITSLIKRRTRRLREDFSEIAEFAIVLLAILCLEESEL